MSYSQDYQADLISLAKMAGVQTSPEVFRVLIELLTLQVSPEEIYSLLQQICLVESHPKQISGKINKRERSH